MISILLNLLSVLAGSFATIAGSMLIQKFIYKKEKMFWLSEHKLDLYLDLISVLDSFEIRIEAIYDTETNTAKQNIDTKYVEAVLNSVITYMDENNAQIFVFAPNEIVSDLHIFKGKLYTLSQKTNNENDIKEYFKLIKESKIIANKLKNDLKLK